MAAKQGKGGKQKGSNFERKIAKQFTEWWQAAGLEGEFYKTPASGGLRWQKRPDVIGDLSVPLGFTHTIECKCREDWEYSGFFDVFESLPDKQNIGGWWWQTLDEAKRADKQPILIIKKAYHEPLCIYDSSDKYLEPYYLECKPFGIGKIVTYDLTICKECSINPVHRITIIPLKWFFEMVEPGALRMGGE